jgi:hypothetical protein
MSLADKVTSPMPESYARLVALPIWLLMVFREVVVHDKLSKRPI